jgi:hypothetical protein
MFKPFLFRFYFDGTAIGLPVDRLEGWGAGITALPAAEDRLLAPRV